MQQRTRQSMAQRCGKAWPTAARLALLVVVLALALPWEMSHDGLGLLGAVVDVDPTTVVSPEPTVFD